MKKMLFSTVILLLFSGCIQKKSDDARLQDAEQKIIILLEELAYTRAKVDSLETLADSTNSKIRQLQKYQVVTNEAIERLEALFIPK